MKIFQILQIKLINFSINTNKLLINDYFLYDYMKLAKNFIILIFVFEKIKIKHIRLRNRTINIQFSRKLISK